MAQTLTPEQAQFLADNDLVRVLRRDPDAAHQPLMLLTSCSRLMLTCNCRRIRGNGWSAASGVHLPIEIRSCWEPGEAVKRYRRHLDEAREAAS